MGRLASGTLLFAFPWRWTGESAVLVRSFVLNPRLDFPHFFRVCLQDKYIVLGPGDNLGRLAKQNGTTVADIAKWNGVRDTRQLGVGVRLIVAKGLPALNCDPFDAHPPACLPFNTHLENTQQTPTTHRSKSTIASFSTAPSLMFRSFLSRISEVNRRW